MNPLFLYLVPFKKRKNMPIHFATSIRHLISAVILLPLFIISWGQKPQPKETIRGIYAHPGPLWEKGYDLRDLGINAIFVRSGSFSQEMVKKARAQGMKVYSEFATLNGKNLLLQNSFGIFQMY